MSTRDVHALTDTLLRDLDPAGAATGLTGDERSRAEAAFARIVSTGDESPLAAGLLPPRRPRRGRRLLVAAAAVAATVVAVPALLPDGPALASWTRTPTPLRGADAAAAAATCRTAMEVPDRGERLLVAEQRGAWTYVLLSSTTSELTCVLPSKLIGADHEDLEGEIFGGTGEPGRAPHVAPDRIVETASQAGNFHGRLLVWLAGYVGRDVVGVTVHSPTGIEIEASVHRGRFAAWWPAGESRIDSPEIADAPTFTVRLSDGSTREVR